MTADEFSNIAPTLPTQAGIYKYYNSKYELLYVGKAKNLKKRISSYFIKNTGNRKTKELVRHIAKIEFTIVNNETDAFLLENELIKEFQPPYNINLKDDKTYPYIVIKNERFPRIFFTRNKLNDGAQYFGPYTSIMKVRDTLNFLKQNIPLRNCKLNLSEKNIAQKKFKVCLEYHLGNCKGPCEALQSEADYMEGIEQLKSILKGNVSAVMQYFKQQMKTYSDNLAFEKAAFIQQKIEGLQAYQIKSAVVNTKSGTVDVFSILEEGDTAYVNYLAVNEGSIYRTKTIVLHKKLEETAAEILTFAIAQLRQTFNSEATEIVVPFAIAYPYQNLTITQPKAGDKKRLLDLSIKNVNFFKAELKAKKMLRLEQKTNAEKLAVLSQLQTDLHLQQLPIHIECFDNSNFQGSFPVAAMVCFKDGIPSKKDYRHFHIKTVEGINDFASMAEAVYRRYKRVLEEKLPIPQLIIIDGGKGQLSSALESMANLGLTGKTTLVGLAKNKEEIFFAGDTESLLLPWDSESLKLIRNIRDEVHRFGITFHRTLRSKAATSNQLENIKGIGNKTAIELLKEFKSVKKIKETPVAAIEKLIGKAKTKLLLEGLK